MPVSTRVIVIFMLTGLCGVGLINVSNAWAKGKNNDAIKRYRAHMDKQIRELQGRRKSVEATLKTAREEFEKVKGPVESARSRVDGAVKAMLDGRSEATDAQRELIAAEQALREAHVKAAEALKADPAAARTVSAYEAAQLAFYKVQKSLVPQVEQNPQMSDLVSRAVDAQARVEQLRRAGAAGNDIAAAALTVADLRKQVAALQDQLLRAIPAYQSARQRYEAAAEIHAAQEEQIASVIANDADVKMHQQAVEQAKAKLSKATQDVGDLNKELTEARSDYSRKLTEAKKVANVVDSLAGQIQHIDRLIADREQKKKRAR